MSAATELTGLPLYDAALAAVDAALVQAQADLADEHLTLEQAVQIVKAFESAQRGFALLRMRADKLTRKMLREGAA
jgi:hypothetical protein